MSLARASGPPLARADDIGQEGVPTCPRLAKPKSLAYDGVAVVGAVDEADAVAEDTGDPCRDDGNDRSPAATGALGGDGFKNAASVSSVPGLSAAEVAGSPRFAVGPARSASRSANVDKSDDGMPSEASGSR